MPTLSPCRNFLAYHAPKTGTSWLAKAWADNGGQRVGEHHGPMRGVRARFPAPRPAGVMSPVGGPSHVVAVRDVATIRNPWDWYVSWYLHATRGEQTTQDLRPKTNPIDECWCFGCVIRVWATCVPGKIGAIWGIPGKRQGTGLFTLTMNYHYEVEPYYWLPTDRLTEAVNTITPGLTLPKPANVRSQDPEAVGAVWTPDLIERVREADAAWIKWGGWEGPGAPTKWLTRRA